MLLAGAQAVNGKWLAGIMGVRAEL
jgi:hypothetical protein